MKKLNQWIFRFLRFWAKLIYPKTELVGKENLPDEPCLIITNHSQIHGPAVGELCFPGSPYIWCTGEMMRMKEVPAYAYKDFWSRKPKHTRWFYKIMSYVIAPLSVCVFNSARTIPVYRDRRIMSTFKDTVKRLNEGFNVIIFPEHEGAYNHILQDFQTGFVDVARIFYKETGKCLQFVPMYLAPALHKMYLGKPVTYCPDTPNKEERRRICDYLMAEISKIAQELPLHRVVPYLNLPKKEYGFNLIESKGGNET